MDLAYIVGPALLIAIVLAAVWLERWSVPVILVALATGIVFGSDLLGLWHFDDFLLLNKVANFALVFILFQGGFGTKRSCFQRVALPSGGLATWGVILTAIFTFAVLYKIFRWPFDLALLPAVVISSTDAAATFSILRRQPIPPRLSSLLEIESAANDPMAILLTIAATEILVSGGTNLTKTALIFLWKFFAAPVIGWTLAKGAIWLYNKINPEERGHYYVLTLGIILLIYGIAEHLRASGMVAVFVAGYIMGNSNFVHKQGVANFSSALSTIANIATFALLGLQVFPKDLLGCWKEGILIFLVISFISRPLAVLVGTIGMKLGWRTKTFISWSGLRGSVPIILATYPAAAGHPYGEKLFNLVFFAVLLSVLVQGSTLGVVAKLLQLTIPPKPRPLFNLDLITMAKSDYDLMIFDLPGPKNHRGPTIESLKLPSGSVITLVSRDKDIIVPNGNTVLYGWDQVTVLAHAKDEDTIRDILMSVFPEPYFVQDDSDCPLKK